MSGEREPDHTNDPRDVSTGQGYPEEQPGGANPSKGSDGRDQGPETTKDLHDDPPAPDTGEDEDSGPGTATGNPDAAGGG